MTKRTVFQSMSQRNIISLSPQSKVNEAAQLMTRTNSSSVLIVDSNHHLLGILTEPDLMRRVLARALDPAKTSVSEVMTRQPQWVEPDTTVEDAVLIMIERGFRHLPIMTSSGGKILGVFSVRDALQPEVCNAVSLAEFHEQVNDAMA